MTILKLKNHYLEVYSHRLPGGALLIKYFHEANGGQNPAPVSGMLHGVLGLDYKTGKNGWLPFACIYLTYPFGFSMLL